MALLPREHGAYGQVALPLATALVHGTLTRPAVYLAVAVVMGFLAHEPLLVLRGGRGARVLRERYRAAVALLVTTAVIGAGAAIGALVSMPAGTWWSVLVPALPACLLAAASLRGREKNLAGELSAALAFSSSALPVGLAGGLPTSSAAAITAVFAAIFVSATLGVRGVILTVRGGGQPHAARATRIATACVSVCAGAAIAVSAAQGVTTWTAVAAASPGLLAAVWLAAAPPSPTGLRTIGWTLVATSTAAAAILLLGGT